MKNYRYEMEIWTKTESAPDAYIQTNSLEVIKNAFIQRVVEAEKEEEEIEINVWDYNDNESDHIAAWGHYSEDENWLPDEWEAEINKQVWGL